MGDFLNINTVQKARSYLSVPVLQKKTDAAKEICVDEVLTFYELQKWIQSEKINLEDFPIEPFDYVCNDKILFPIPGETADFLEKKNPKKTVFCVDGIEDCKSVLNSIRNNKFENTFLK